LYSSECSEKVTSPDRKKTRHTLVPALNSLIVKTFQSVWNEAFNYLWYV